MSEDCAVVYLTDEHEVEEVATRLQSFGVAAKVAESARDLGIQIERHSPAFLVLDGPLAERSGLDVLGWLRHAGLDIPTVFLCASSYESDGLSSRTELRPFLACRDLTREVLSRVLVRLRMADSDTEMAVSGSLDGFDVTDLLLWALRCRWTGRLVLESGGISKTIFIDTGIPVFCSSNILSENFGRLLLKRGIISEQDYERARELQLKERIRQGEALIRLGVLQRDELEGYLRDQVEEKLLNAIAWSGGNYALEKGDTFRSRFSPANLNPIALLIEGEKRFRSPRETAKRWQRMQPLYVAATGARPDVAALVHGVLSDDVRDALRQPSLLGELARRFRWDARESVATVSVLERAGYLALAERPEMLPAATTDKDEEPTAQPSAVGDPERSEPPTAEVVPWEPTEAQIHDLLEELYESYFRTASANAFKLLGVEPSAPPDQVIRARDDLLRRFSESRFAPVIGQTKHAKALERLRMRITEAADGLLDPKRHQFTRAETSQSRTTREVSMKKLVQAEEEFRRGMELLDQAPRKALAHFSSAADLNPKDPLYLLFHGWARYQCAATPGERTKGYGMIKRAVDANPIMPEGQLVLARALQAEGRTSEAVERARTAHAFEPDNREVIAFLESLGVKARPTPQRQG